MMPNLTVYLRSLSQFHEHERLVVKLANQPWVHYLTPARRRTLLYYGAFIAGYAALLRRNAAWKEYGNRQTWVAPGVVFPLLAVLLFSLYRASRNFAAWPALIRRNPQIALLFSFWLLLIALWTIPSNAG